MRSKDTNSVNQILSEELVKSGETTVLTHSQKRFNEWLNRGVSGNLTDTIWSLNSDFINDPGKQNLFFSYIEENIRSIPPGQYLLHYLLGLYVLYFSEKEFLRLWDFVQSEEFNHVNLKTKNEAEQTLKSIQNKLFSAEEDDSPQLTRKDYLETLSAICEELKSKLPNGIASDKNNWQEKFVTMIKAPALKDIQDLALGMGWDWETYQLFRSKAFKKRDADFMNKKEVFLFLSLNYAKECNLSAYKAFNRLKRNYPDPSRRRKNQNQEQEGSHKERGNAVSASTTENEEFRKEERRRAREARRKQFDADRGNTSIVLQDNLRKRLLIPENREKLFTEKLTFLQDYFQEIYDKKKAQVKRSPQAVFYQEWETFADTVGITEYKTDNTRDGKYKPDEYIRKRSDLFRWLYGDNVTQRVDKKDMAGLRRINRNNLVSLAPQGSTDFFLDSEEFFNTMISDAVFNEQQPITDETRLRNLILTVGFLNFTYTDWLARWDMKWSNPNAENTFESFSSTGYQDRLSEFEFAMMELTDSCGFLSLHSGNAYDAFLKLLLSCDEPFDLFRYIWRMKTGSSRNLDLIQDP